MNANRLISMAVNMILRRVMRTGIDAGFNALSKRKTGQTSDAAETPQQAAPDTRDVQKRMRHAVRLGRRMGRF